jgi:hypothetical protein
MRVNANTKLLQLWSYAMSLSQNMQHMLLLVHGAETETHFGCTEAPQTAYM